MSALVTVVVVIQVLASLGIIGLVLLQQGKGADAGAAFGSGSAGAVFGSAGAGNALSRATAILAAIFFICTLSLTFLGSRSLNATGAQAPVGGIMQSIPGQLPADAPPASSPSSAPKSGKDAKAVPAPKGVDQIPR